MDLILDISYAFAPQVLKSLRIKLNEFAKPASKQNRKADP
jgi:hypothetical protein